MLSMSHASPKSKAKMEKGHENELQLQPRLIMSINSNALK